MNSWFSSTKPQELKKALFFASWEYRWVIPIWGNAGRPVTPGLSFHLTASCVSWAQETILTESRREKRLGVHLFCQWSCHPLCLECSLQSFTSFQKQWVLFFLQHWILLTSLNSPQKLYFFLFHLSVKNYVYFRE